MFSSSSEIVYLFVFCTYNIVVNIYYICTYQMHKHVICSVGGGWLTHTSYEIRLLGGVYSCQKYNFWGFCS